MVDINFVLFSLTAGLIVVWALLTFHKNRQLPPGPWGFPFIGYYPFLKSEPHEQAIELSKRYNSDIISFKSFGNLIIILNGLENTKHMLLSRSDEFIGRPLKANLLRWLDDGLGVAQEEGIAWREQRRFFLHAIKDFGFGRIELEPKIHEEIQILIEDFKSLNGKVFKPLDYFVYTANCVITPMLFSKRFEKSDPFFKECVEGLHNVAEIFLSRRLFLFGYLFRLDMMLSKDVKQAERAKKFLFKITTNILDEHKKTFDPHHIRDFLDAYLLHMKNLKEKGELENSSFSVKRLIAVTFNMLLEGTESIAYALNSLITRLARYPEVQKKAQEELDSIVGRNKLPSWLDKQKLPYTEAVITELFRVNQPFFLSTSYSNFEETTIKGYLIPKRSVLFANLWSINQDPKLFPEPSKFDPNRHLTSDGKRIKTDGPYPFSIGKRSCIAEPLARMEVFLVISALLQNFTLYAESEDEIRAVSRN